MNYLSILKSSSDRNGSIVCLGLDPIIEEIPISGSPRNVIVNFYHDILNKMVQKETRPSAVKPNYAFYSQYGLEGLEALAQVIDLFSHEGFPIILDVKRGDIDKTAAAYAREAFEFLKADAVTLSPYMGRDSIRPFQEQYPEKGYYILTRTSNASASEIQDTLIEKDPLYIHVARKIIEWYSPGIGSVVGATYPDQLFRIVTLFNNSDREVPLLIPGIGAQGGDLIEVVRILKLSGDIRIHRINSSSGINYAYKKHPDLHFADAALLAFRELNDDINRIRSAN